MTFYGNVPYDLKNMDDRSEVQAYIDEKSKELTRAKSELELTKTAVDVDSLKTIRKQIDVLSNQRNKLSSALSDLRKKSEELFWDGYDCHYDTDRWNPTNIYPEVMTAVKTHVKISKLSRDDVLSLVRALAQKHYETHNTQIIAENEAKIKELGRQEVALENQIEERQKKLNSAQNYFNGLDRDVKRAKELLRDKEYWKKFQEKKKRAEDKDSERDRAFSDEVIQAIYDDAMKGVQDE